MTLGEYPFVLLQVVQGPIPDDDVSDPFMVEVHSGGGLGIDQVPFVLQAVMDALAIGDMGITASGFLIRRTEAGSGPEATDP